MCASETLAWQRARGVRNAMRSFLVVVRRYDQLCRFATSQKSSRSAGVAGGVVVLGGAESLRGVLL